MTESMAQRIWLWEGQAPGPQVKDDFRPWLDLYLLDTRRPRGAVLVLPGGGYTHRAAHEGEPIARRFNEQGYHAFMAQYRVQPHPPMSAFLDAQRSVRLVRSRAAEWNIAPGQLAVCGFSAGGHLTALVGVYGDEGQPLADDRIERYGNRPDALILCYAWLSAMSIEPNDIRILSGENVEETRRRISAELHVTDKTPPAFLWHTSDDQRVLVRHSLAFAEALGQHGVPFELHVYPHGRHGLGLAREDARESTRVATWTNLCGEWLEGLGWKSGLD